MLNTKRMSGYLFAMLSVFQIAAFFLYRQATEHLESKWLVYIVYWLWSLAEAAVPLLAAAALLLLFTKGHRRLLLFPILPVLSRVLYYLPDHYLYYIADGLTTAEALGMGAIVTLLECGALYGLILLFFWIAKASLTKRGKEEARDFKFEDKPIFSLENPFVKSVFFTSFSYFCLQITIELVRTVSYLISNAGTYTAEEILTLLLSFFMHFVLFLGMHALCVLYLRYAKRHYTRED